MSVFDPLLELLTSSDLLYEVSELPPGFILVCAHCQQPIMKGKVHYDNRNRPYDAYCWGMRYSIGLVVPDPGRVRLDKCCEGMENDG
jgi:hypothetical protein